MLCVELLFLNGLFPLFDQFAGQTLIRDGVKGFNCLISSKNVSPVDFPKSPVLTPVMTISFIPVAAMASA